MVTRIKLLPDVCPYCGMPNDCLYEMATQGLQTDFMFLGLPCPDNFLYCRSCGRSFLLFAARNNSGMTLVVNPEERPSQLPFEVWLEGELEKLNES